MQYDENAEKYGYEGEMTPLKCDALKAYKGDVTIPVYGTIADAEVYLKEGVDDAIAELKEFAEDACIERDDNQTAIDELQAEIAELKQKLENAKATHYAESVDAGMRERRLKRALWMARAELCRRLDVDRYLRKHINSWYNENCLTWAEACVAMEVKMCKAESKCRAKVEKFK